MEQELKFNAAPADLYELQMGRFSRLLAESFLDFAGVADGDRALDVGCGTGNLTFAMCARANVAAVSGIDLASGFIDAANEAADGRPVEFQVGDATALPYEGGTFDRVYSQLVLQFFDDAMPAIAEMKRVARPGAPVAASTWNTAGSLVATRQIFDTAAMIDPDAARRRDIVYSRPLSGPGELAQAWRDSGFADVAETMLPIHMEFASFDDYWIPITTGGGPVSDYCKTLDTELLATIREAVRPAYLAGRPDGPRSYIAAAWAVKGTAK